MKTSLQQKLLCWLVNFHTNSFKKIGKLISWYHRISDAIEEVSHKQMSL